MNFTEIVEMVEKFEEKLEGLSESKLDLVEKMLIESTDVEFDVGYYFDHIVEFVNSYSDEQAEIIKENIDGVKVLEIVLEASIKNGGDIEEVINEAKEQLAQIEIEADKIVENEEADSEETAVPLLSIVSSTLTEMLGEEAVEELPAEMVFDIANATLDLDFDDSLFESEEIDAVAIISERLQEALENGEIDFDTEDYEGETLSEFLADYEDMNDLLSEMEKVNDEVLAEATDEEGAELLRKAKEATTLIEAKLGKCKTKACMIKKGKAAAKYFQKHEMHGGFDPKEVKISTLKGKLGRYVRAAAKSLKKRYGKVDPLYLQFVLLPGILKRMRYKARKMKASAMKTKQGMKAVK